MMPPKENAPSAGGGFRDTTARGEKQFTTAPLGINGILDRLTRVRKTGPDSWSACCPAHDDKGPSLSIRDADGKVLLHCFTGCSVHEIAGAIGVDLADLFPPRESSGRALKNPFPSTDALRAVSFEALVVASAAKRMANGEQMSKEGFERLLQAAERINAALSATGIERGKPWQR